MFDRVWLVVSDLAASERFYSTVLTPLGWGGEPSSAGEDHVTWGDLAILAATDDRPPTRGVHLGLVAPSARAVHAFWQAGVDAGYRSDGEPGPRPVYGDDYVGGFLLDPDGNSIEAALHENLRTDGGLIDHVTVGVSDLAEQTAFYDLIAPHLEYARRAADGTLTRWRNTRGEGRDGGSFTMIADGRPAAEHLRMTFPVASRAEVDAFHATAVAAGHESVREPGPHEPGPYAAAVRDPAGHGIGASDAAAWRVPAL